MTLKTKNRAGQAFRMAAQSVQQAECAFGVLYRRLRARLGPAQATVATAHANDEGAGSLRGVAAKAHHVSPFLPRELDHRFRFGTPGARLVARIADLDREGRRCFDAVLSLRRRELGGAALARALVRWPAMTAQVIGGIHWQALRLWWKGAPFHPHPRTTREALEDPT